jgi:PIN domain nuclease of toxin-antitoxin system
MTTEGPPVVLDTVAFIFWHADSPRLSASARAALLEAPARAVYVSAASAFEIATKVRLGKLAVPAALLQDFPYVVEADGFRLLNLDAATAIRAGQLEGEHLDPFDRVIAAQALVAGAAIVTNDLAFAAMGVEVLC